MESTSLEQGIGENQSDARAARSGLRVHIWWVAWLVVVLLLMLLAPPLINVNRLRHRIAESMSASLGRPVHLDGVTMHLLPIPGFTLENLVVSEDPAFGSEPIIRANTVEITLRPSSLWRRQVELSSVRFVEPSLNLVRDGDGQWNVQSLLMHAAQVSSAPTAQTKPGPAPRFPYIEATGGRVNLKLGEEKQPFSLTETDFALWQPTPEQWRVRLEGKPVRTDMNASDTGTVRLEGQLGRASLMGSVPVDLRGSWHDAPLGEASKLMVGRDAGWRGTMQVDATLAGQLASAKLQVVTHLNDLRRADFVPATLLDLRVECNGVLDLPDAVVTQPSCTMPANRVADNWSFGKETPPENVVAIADRIELPNLRMKGFGGTGVRVGMTDVPDAWLLEWARLFSQRIPNGEAPQGTVTGSMVLQPPVDDGPLLWQGEFHTDVAKPELAGAALLATNVVASRKANDLRISMVANGRTLSLEPLTLELPVAAGSAKPEALVLTGSVTAAGYSVHVTGTATPRQLNSLRALLPPLGDGLEAAVPALADPEAASKPEKVSLTCTRAWGGAPVCAAVEPEPTKVAREKHGTN